MPTARTNELLYDSQATLRLVDQELDALGAGPRASHAIAEVQKPTSLPTDALGLAALPFILDRANAEITAVLGRLRESRTALRQATDEKLQRTHEKLREVTSATEVAATDILDSLDRAGSIVDQLDAEDEGKGSENAFALRATLRDEIFGMMGALQFQDITTQQLSYASSVLVDLEERLSAVAEMFEVNGSTTETVAAKEPPVGPVTFDPQATTRDAERRQALADEILKTAAG